MHFCLYLVTLHNVRSVLNPFLESVHLHNFSVKIMDLRPEIFIPYSKEFCLNLLLVQPRAQIWPPIPIIYPYSTLRSVTVTREKGRWTGSKPIGIVTKSMNVCGSQGSRITTSYNWEKNYPYVLLNTTMDKACFYSLNVMGFWGQ